MKRLDLNQMESVEGAGWSAACGFATGVAAVAAFATAPIAPATWGFIGATWTMACGAATLESIKV